MKNVFSILCICLVAFGMFSCGENAKSRAQRELIDSLETENAQVRMDYDDLQRYLSVIAVGLDSILQEENELLFGTKDGEKRRMNRQHMRHQLSHVRDLLSRHRERIAELERQLANGKGNVQSLRTIVASLKQQLEAKDLELEKLRAKLEDSRVNIEKLTEQLGQMREEQNVQNETIAQQQPAIAEKEKLLYRCYVRIGDKKELKRLGLLSGGFLKKKKVDYSNLDVSLFEEMDIRNVKKFSLPGKAKIMTPVPDGSYQMVAEENGKYTLLVLDQRLFWSASKFLIIQTD